MRVSRILLAAFLALAMIAAACGDDDTANTTTSTEAPTVATGAPTSATETPTTEASQTTTSQADSDEPTLPDIGTLTVGYIPILGFAPFFVAIERGYFANEGLEVELQSFRSGGPMIAPLATSQLDVGGGEPGVALFNAAEQGLDVATVSALASQPAGYGAVPLLVRTELLESGEVSQVGDLAGRTVAINIGQGTAEYLLSEALSQEDLTIDDVTTVEIPFPEMQVAFENGAIDAAILPHPLAGRAIGEGAARVLLEGDQVADNPQNGVVYFGQRLLEEENREVAIRFLVAYLRAARDLQGDGWRSDSNAGAINTWTEVPIPAIQNGVAYYFDPTGQINVASFDDIQAYHVSRGYTLYEELLPPEQVIDDSFLAEALARLDG